MTESQLLELFKVPEECPCPLQETLGGLGSAAKHLCREVQSPRRRRAALLVLLEYRHQIIMDSLERSESC